jgi:hypothetical protein
VKLPEKCFCGCGLHVGKNTENMSGFIVSMEIGYWLLPPSIVE